MSDCPHCSKSISSTKGAMAKHQKTKACMKIQEEKKKIEQVPEIITDAVIITKMEIDSLSLSQPQIDNKPYSAVNCSERAFYENIIAELRAQLAQALASNMDLVEDKITLVAELIDERKLKAKVTSEIEVQTDCVSSVSNCDTQTDSDTVSVNSDASTVSMKSNDEVEKNTLIFIETYSDRSFVVRGETYFYKTKLLELGGKFNRYLTEKTTQKKFAGWIFSNSKRADVETFVATQK